MIYGAEYLTNNLRDLGRQFFNGVFVNTSLSKIGRVIGGLRDLIDLPVTCLCKDGLYDPTPNR